MDITRSIIYRGLPLTGADNRTGENPGHGTPVQGIRTTRIRFSDVTVHGYTEKKSLDDGFDASDVFLGKRMVVIEGEVYAVTKAGLFDVLDVMRLTFTPTDAFNQDERNMGYVPLTFEQATAYTEDWPSGIIPRELRCRPAAQPEYTLAFAQLQGDENRGYVCPFSVRLEAKDPRFYGVVDITHALSGAGSGDPLPSVRNRGNYQAPVSFVIVCSDSAQQTFRFTGMGSDMTLIVPGGTGQRRVVVDGWQKVVTTIIGGVEALRMDLITFGAQTTWPRCDPTPQNTDPVEFTWSFTGTLDTGSRLLFRETWA